MVRAAVSGAINYAGADPQNRQWRLKHRILLAEVERREDYELLTIAHKHWLALLSHGNLTEESFKEVKKQANEVMGEIQKTTFPWVAVKEAGKDAEKDTIVDSSTQALIDRYKQQLTNKTG
jgi:hypothetical protein